MIRDRWRPHTDVDEGGAGGQVAVWRLEAKSLLAPGPSADVVLFIINTSLGGLNSD